MEEKAYLLQRIEFLEFQLEDSKTREIQTKSMYESIISSFSQNCEKSQDDENLLKLNEQRMHNDLEKIALNDKLKHLESKNECLVSEINLLNSKCKDLKRLNFERNADLQRLIDLKDEKVGQLNHSISDLENRMKNKDIDIETLKNQIENMIHTHSDDIYKISQDNNIKLNELKSIYQTQVSQLHHKYSRLDSENQSQSACTYFTLLLSNLESCSSRQNLIQQTLTKIHKDTKTSLSDLCQPLESELPSNPGLSHAQKLEITEKLISINSSINSSLNSYKSSLNSLRSIVKKTQEKQKTYKAQLDVKSNEIESLKKSLFLRVNQMKDPNYYIEEIVHKDKEISSLKRIVGELRSDQIKSKPPFAAFQHKRAKTLPFKLSLKSESSFDETNNFTTASTDRNGDDKVEVYMRKIEQLRASNMKLRNQRERAKALSEKLVLELKEKKVEVAVATENHQEDKVRLQSYLKEIVIYLKSVWTSAITPKFLKQDIEKVLKKFDKFGWNL